MNRHFHSPSLFGIFCGLGTALASWSRPFSGTTRSAMASFLILSISGTSASCFCIRSITLREKCCVGLAHLYTGQLVGRGIVAMV